MLSVISCVASIVVFLVAQAAPAQVLDSARLHLMGYVEDVCSVAAIGTASGRGLDNLSTFRSGKGVQTASLGFDFRVQNDSDPTVPTIGAIDQGVISVELDLYCNGPFRFTIEAANGDLRNEKFATNTSDFTNRLTYAAALALPDGSMIPPASSSGAAGVIISEPNVAPQDGTAMLTLSFQNPAGRKLISGTYTEFLKVSFAQDGNAPPPRFSRR